MLCGITKDLSKYSLRHLLTTLMIKTRPDVSMKVISEILGHTDMKMIDKHYGHLRIEQTVKILEHSEEKKEEILKARKHNSQFKRQMTGFARFFTIIYNEPILIMGCMLL